jgi:predicted HicB family RNase H-like nuclease
MQNRDAEYKYKKRAIKRIPLDVQKSKYAEIQKAAEEAGETINGYIKKAIDMRLDACN